MTTNPYIERGIVPSDKEWEIMKDALGGQARFFEANGMAVEQKLAIDMIRRYGQVKNAGTGFTDDVLERYQRRIVVALKRRNLAAFKEAYADMFATAIRLAPDPAEECGRMLVRVLEQVQLAKALELASMPLLGRVGNEIETCLADIKEGTSEPDEVLEYLRQWVATGLSNSMQGLEPWPEVDETPAPPEEAQAT